MKRSAFIILVIATLVGCATSREEIVADRTLEQQLEAYIDEYLEQSLDLCIEMHGQAMAGESPVDCAFRGDLSSMHLSLPSVGYHNNHLADINRLEYHWCAAAMSKTGQRVIWSRHFRKENSVMSRPCYKGPELRRLIENVQEREAVPN